MNCHFKLKKKEEKLLRYASQEIVNQIFGSNLEPLYLTIQIGILKLKNSQVEAALGDYGVVHPRSTRVRLVIMAILMDENHKEIIKLPAKNNKEIIKILAKTIKNSKSQRKP